MLLHGKITDKIKRMRRALLLLRIFPVGAGHSTRHLVRLAKEGILHAERGCPLGPYDISGGAPISAVSINHRAEARRRGTHDAHGHFLDFKLRPDNYDRRASGKGVFFLHLG